ncbi:breast cancer metastasis-suppressor 1-like protein-A [Tetranychus urticae]|uniref:Breast cancer metastasis-suppressor 1-like protein-A n=1 Tax=Tetranychus urticae TaxID=32264 RepID=T1KEG0_TETUR|nr:breast cancer metastasis-suppressor 1-like protein-A [Tetranychus urticae]
MVRMEVEGSPDSFKGTHYSNEDTDSEFAGSDYDNEDTSELDEEECEVLKTEHINEMLDLERQFLALKEQLYMERIKQIEKKLEEVKAGNAQEYLGPVDDLHHQMEIRMKVAGILKEFKFKNVNIQYEAEKQAVDQNFQSEKNLARDQIRRELEERIRRLEEDRNSVDLWGDSLYNPKKKRRIGNNGSTYYEVGPSRDQLHLLDRRRKPVPVSGPYIVYMLKDSEIIDDWTQIRKACRSTANLTDPLMLSSPI